MSIASSASISLIQTGTLSSIAFRHSVTENSQHKSSRSQNKKKNTIATTTFVSRTLAPPPLPFSLAALQVRPHQRVESESRFSVHEVEKSKKSSPRGWGRGLFGARWKTFPRRWLVVKGACQGEGGGKAGRGGWRGGGGGGISSLRAGYYVCDVGYEFDPLGWLIIIVTG